MKKIFKYTAISLGVIFLFLLVAPFLFKGKIIEAVKQAANDNLNAVVNFDDVSLSLIRNFPNLRIKITNFTVDNLAPFDSVRLAQIGSLEAVVDIKSVLGDEIMVKKIGIINPVFDVRVLPDGKANYDIAKADTAAVVETPADTSASAFKIKLKKYFIENGTVNYNDQSMPMLLKLFGLNHTGNGDFTSDLFVLNTLTTAKSGTFWFDGITYVNQAKLDLKAQLEMDMKNMKFSFKENELKLNELFLKADGWVAMPDENIDMDIQFAATKTDFKNLLSMVPAEFAKDLTGVDASGKMALDGFIRGTYNEKSLPGIGLNVMVENGRFKYPDLPKSVENIQIKSSVVVDMNKMDNTTVDVDRFHLEMAQNPVDLTLKLRTPESDPDIDFFCKAFIDLDNVKEFIPLEKGDEVHGQINTDIKIKGRMSYAEKQQYDRFDAQGMLGIKNVLFKSDSLPYDVLVDDLQLAVTPAYLDLSAFKARIGRSDINATGKITHYLNYLLRDSLLTGNLSLNAQLMDLNEWMANDESSDQPDQTTQPTTADTALSPIVLPGNIDFNLIANFEKMLYGNIEITHVKGGIGLKDRIATLKNLTMDVLDGSVSMSGNYNAQNPEKPKMDFIFDILDMDIHQAATQFNTIDKLAPIAKACNGKFSTKMSLKSDLGQDMMPIYATVNGSGSLATKNVVIKDFEPLVKLADKIGLEELKKSQNITNINVIFKIKDGVVNVDPFNVKVADMPLKLYGYTTLDQIIDYNAEMDVPFEKFPGNLVNQANSFIGEINKKAGVNLSVGKKVNVIARITGTVTDPKIGVTSKLLGQDALNDLKQQAVEAVKQEVIEKAVELKNEALERAIAEKDRIIAEAQKQADKLKAEAQQTAQKLKDEAYKVALQTENSAKNPLEKIAKKAAADKIRKEADNAYNKAISEANSRADNIVKDAAARADKAIQDANTAGDKQMDKVK